MLILLYGNTLVCWLVTFLPSVMRPISSEGRLRQGQMKLSSFQTFKQIFFRQCVIFPEKQLWQILLFCTAQSNSHKIKTNCAIWCNFIFHVNATFSLVLVITALSEPTHAPIHPNWFLHSQHCIPKNVNVNPVLAGPGLLNSLRVQHVPRTT